MKFKQSLKRRLLYKAKTAVLVIAAIVLGQFAAVSQSPTTVSCADGFAYILTSGENGPALYRMALTGSATPTLVTSYGAGTSILNALGYNAADGYLYAIDANGIVYRIGANGVRQVVTVSDPNPPGPYLASGFTAGDVSATGKYYIYNNTTKQLVSIDLTQNPAPVTLVATLAAGTGQIDDFAFHPINGNIYAVTAARQLLEITPAGIVTVKGTVGGSLTGSATKGTAFMDAVGNMYVGQNGNGTLYRIPNPASGSTWNATVFSTTLDALNNLGISPFDGARCASALPPSAGDDDRKLTALTPVNINVINGVSDGWDDNTTATAKDNQGTYPINTTSTVLYIDNVPATAPDADGEIFIPGKGTFKVQPDGTVTFTPVAGFTGEATVWYTIKDNQGTPLESNRASITVWVDGGVTLPVEFGALSAILSNNHLAVNWATLSETNNSYFEIEASKDGENFQKIGTVNTKAAAGNADVSISYDFSIDLQNGGSLLGITVFALAFVALLFNRKNKWLYTLFIVCGLSIIGATSCSKEDAAGIDVSNSNVYVRIKQVDKNGNAAYSKVVQVIKK